MARPPGWVASYHALHGLAGIELEDSSRAFAGAITASDIAHRELGDGLYTIAALAYGGTTSSMRKGPRTWVKDSGKGATLSATATASLDEPRFGPYWVPKAKHVRVAPTS